MNRTVCRSIRSLFGPYIDGELTGADRLRVAHHLDACGGCAADVAAMAAVGDLLRVGAAGETPPPRFEGLASSVVTRISAESAASWGARFARATGDGRLLWVGAGSVLGAAATTILVAFTLFFGQAPARADSLASVLGSVGAEGTLMMIARPGDGRTEAFIVQFRGPSHRVITEAMLTGPSEEQLVDLLAEAVTRHGRVVELSDMPLVDRLYTESLLDEIKRRRTKELVRVEVKQMRLVEWADVSAKGL